MRSSIACEKCRRSKVKCDNEGLNSICKACQASGRECRYPLPAASGASSSAKRQALGDASQVPTTGIAKRPRIKKDAYGQYRGGELVECEDVFIKATTKVVDDALNSPLLTTNVWIQLVNIFKRHYSTELPFLHSPSFCAFDQESLEDMQPPSPTSSTIRTRPPYGKPFVLAFLCLTSRFHPGLVAHHDPQGLDPMRAANFYYDLAAKCTPQRFTDHTMGLETVQTYLMMAHHDWGAGRGSRAWIAVGTAVRAAHALGLHVIDDSDSQPNPDRNAASLFDQRQRNTRRGSVQTNVEPVIMKEIQRRTLWSCFIMDRYLSSGKRRPQMFNKSDLFTRLPGDENQFLSGEEAHAQFLAEPITGYESVLSRYIRAVDLYGRISIWACHGGRRSENHAPWLPDSSFYKFCTELSDLQKSLPANLTLAKKRYTMHLSDVAAPYQLVHTIFLFCTIMLHREYVPYIPLKCSKPEGPKDAPRIDTDAPQRWWEDSAATLFKSARDLVDLLRTSKEADTLVETPLIGFALYTTAFTGIYSKHFTHMDQYEYMCTRSTSGRSHGYPPEYSGGTKATEKALELLNHLRQRSSVAHGWAKTIYNLDDKYTKYKQSYRESQREGHSASTSNNALDHYGSRNLSICKSDGGGLEEYRTVEKLLNEFGNIGAKDLTPTGEPERNQFSNGTAERENTRDRAPSMIKSESMPTDPATSPRPRQEGWSAINLVPGDSQLRESKYGVSSTAHETNTALPQPTYQRSHHSAGYNSSSATPFQSVNTAPSEPSPLVSPTGRSLSNPITPSMQDTARWIPPIHGHHQPYPTQQLSPQSSISTHSPHASMPKAMYSIAELSQSELPLANMGPTGFNPYGWNSQFLNTSITADDWVMFTYGMDANSLMNLTAFSADHNWLQTIQN